MRAVTYRQTVMVWPFLLAAALLAVVLGLGAPGGVVALVLIVAAACAVLFVPRAVTCRIDIDDDTIRMRGFPPYNGFNHKNGRVDLRTLTDCRAVYDRQGVQTNLGAAGARPARSLARMLMLSDAAGNRQLIWRSGWSDRQALYERLRDAVTATGASYDEATAERLRLPSSTPTW